MKMILRKQTSPITWSLLLALFVGSLALSSIVEAADTPVLYLFWGEGCPHCEKEKEFLIELQQRYPQLEMRFFETWKHSENRELAAVLRQAYDITRTGVPLTLLGDWFIVGFGSPESTGAEIERQIEACLQEGCLDALDKSGPRRIAAKIKADAETQQPAGWELYPAAEAQE